MTKEAMIEGVKQFVRVILAAALPVLIAGVQGGRIEWSVVGMAVFMAVLLGLDKWVHEDPKIDAKGILPTFGK